MPIGGLMDRFAHQWRPWQLVLPSVLLSAGLAALASIVFYGRTTAAFVVSGTVISFLVAYPVVRLLNYYRNKLAESEERFRDLTEMSSDWFWEQDAAFRFTFISGGLASKGRFRVADAIGKARWEMPIEDISEAEWAKHRAMLERHEPFSGFIYRVRASDGEPHWYSISGKPVFNPEGGFRGYHGVGNDITRQVESERTIRELNETLEQRVRDRTAELEASHRELESLSYSLSHDLRTPLRAMHGYSHLLTEDYGPRLNEHGLHYLARIRLAAERMGKLIDDIHDLVLINRQQLEMSEIDLTALAEGIARSVEAGEPQRKAIWSIAPGMKTRADPMMMRVLITHLLGNAWKFTAEREPALIEFGQMRSGDEPAFFVRDNGIGFEMAYADKLFRSFQHIHDPHRYEGTGIGLAMAKRIVQRHGGRIWAEGEPGSGATFYFTLP